MILIGAVLYTAATAIPALVLQHMEPPGGAVGRQAISWLAALPLLVLLAPFWTALHRFIIVKDDSRRYFVWDMRMRRVLLVTFVLSFVSMLGGMSLVFGIAAVSRLGGRRLVILGVLAASFLARVATWWLSCRLSIAPPLAAAGTRPNALDTAFAYTPGVVLRILGVQLVIYLPLFALIGGTMLMEHIAPRLQANFLFRPALGVAVAAITACAEFVEGAAMALIAVKLVNARRAATLAATVEAAA
jgi:hypothetical protein